LGNEFKVEISDSWNATNLWESKILSIAGRIGLISSDKIGVESFLINEANDSCALAWFMEQVDLSYLLWM
jgi:hypothetical protein